MEVRTRAPEGDLILGLLEDVALVGVMRSDGEGNCTYVNRQWCDFAGIQKELAVGLGWTEALHPEDRERVLEGHEHSRRSGEPFRGEYRLRRPDGRVVSVLGQGLPLRSEEGGALGFVEITVDITERGRDEQVLRARNRILKELATGSSLEDVLTVLAETAQDVLPGLTCSVLLLDRERGRLLHGAAPNLPEFYNRAIHGFEIGPGRGSCGTAAYTGERVIVEDVSTHPYWAPWRELAEQAGFRSCWSEPIFSVGGEILGTFAMYYREPRSPDAFELNLIRTTAQVAGIAIERKRAEDSLLQSEERFRQLAESISEVFWLTDWEQHRVLYVSPAYESIWGEPCRRLYDNARSWADRIHPVDRDRVVAAFLANAESGAYDEEYRIVRDDGGVRWIHDRAFPIRDASGAVYRVAGISTDITARKTAEHELQEARGQLEERVLERTSNLRVATKRLEEEVAERRRAEEELAKSQHFVQQVMDATPLVLHVFDLVELRMVYVNSQIHTVLGYTPEELVGMGDHVLEIVHPSEREACAELLGGARRGGAGEIVEVEYRARHADGGYRWLHTRGVVFSRDADGTARQIVATAQDVTERRRKDKALEEYQSQLRSLSWQLVVAEERERRRLADDLHDELNQTITIAMLKLADARREADGDMAGILEEIERHVARANQSARSLTFQLSPPVLHDFGFEAAIEWLVEDFQKTHNLEITLHDDGVPEPMAESVRVILFRATRELLLNVVKHARASTVRIFIERGNGCLYLSVADDGVSFDPEKTTGFGLFGIRERLTGLGGRMEIRSTQGKGSEVVLAVPLEPDVRADG